jgi:hypothetical protein
VSLLRASLVALVVCGAARAQEQTCIVYEEGFSAFSGPQNEETELFVASWCVSNAAVANGGFCPGGPAFKLDSAADDPMLWVRPLHDTCTNVVLSFSYSQFAATGTVLRRLVSSDATMNCAKSVTASALALNQTGAACHTVIDTVVVEPGQSVYWKFDHGTPGSNALFIDFVVVSVAGCCDAHSCCEAGPAGCEDAGVAACVCEADPFCCAQQWDAICVEEVESLRCGLCGPPPTACGDSFQADFGVLFQSGSVCQLFPDLFELCEGAAPFISSTSSCGGLSDMTMRFSAGFPYSAAVTRCLDLSAYAKPELRFRYAKNSGSLGPRVEISTDDRVFNVLWTAPVSAPSDCIEQVIDLSPYAGASNVRLKFSSGSSVSSGAAFDDLLLSEGVPPHDCCQTGPPGCGDARIQTCVCAEDPFCCEGEWDALCVSAADACGAECTSALFCGSKAAGDCFAASSTPFCTDGACCVAICSVDIFCCDDHWDELCAQEAQAVCNGGACGSGGPCSQPHPQPGCDDGACCSTVCLNDAVCCLIEWDEICVAAQEALCEAALIGDLNQDGRVDGADLGLLLASWGSCEAAAGSCEADLNADGAVNGADLGTLLANWSP